MQKTDRRAAPRAQALERAKSAVGAYARNPCAATEQVVETAIKGLKRESAPAFETAQHETKGPGFGGANTGRAT